MGWADRNTAVLALSGHPREEDIWNVRVAPLKETDCLRVTTEEKLMSASIKIMYHLHLPHFPFLVPPFRPLQHALGFHMHLVVLRVCSQRRPEHVSSPARRTGGKMASVRRGQSLAMF